MKSNNTRPHTTVLHSLNNSHIQKAGVWIFTTIGLVTAAWIWVSLILA